MHFGHKFSLLYQIIVFGLLVIIATTIILEIQRQRFRFSQVNVHGFIFLQVHDVDYDEPV